MTERNEYPLNLVINHNRIKRVIIDQHYKDKHPSVTDEIILDLVRTLDGEDFPVESERGEYQYFAVEPVYQNERPYRLVMLLCNFEDYLGVINAFRVDRRKYE